MDKYYFTNAEYKTNYKSLLRDYINQHIDNEMEDFNKLQIEKYKYGLDFIELIVRPYNFDEMPHYINFELFEDLMDYFNIKNHNIKSYQDFCRCFENKNFDFSLDIAFNGKYDYLIKSWHKIIDFLNATFELISSNSEPDALDLSNTRAVDKILYLHKLGIIDFLRGQQPFNTSVNSLATIFSAITGEKSGTLQPMLNPMSNKSVDDSNNPLNSKKAVERVKNQLINIGFNLNETI